MHILLTDILTCPRCGPEFGLTLLADRISERRVLEGRLGCANCREQYPVWGGVVDVRLPGARSADADPGAAASSAEVSTAAGGGQEAVVRLAALLGLADAQGKVLIAGPGAALAAEVAALVPEVEVIALTAEASGVDASPGVTRMVGATVPLPFRGRALRGVALTGGGDEAALMEALRVLQPGARLVVEGAAPSTADTLSRLGAQVMLDQEGTVVARWVGEPVQLRVNAVR